VLGEPFFSCLNKQYFFITIKITNFIENMAHK